MSWDGTELWVADLDEVRRARASASSWPVGSTSRSFSRSGLPTTRSTSSPTGRAGGTCTAGAAAGRGAIVCYGCRVRRATVGTRNVHLRLRLRRPHHLRLQRGGHMAHRRPGHRDAHAAASAHAVHRDRQVGPARVVRPRGVRGWLAVHARIADAARARHGPHRDAEQLQRRVGRSGLRLQPRSHRVPHHGTG